MELNNGLKKEVTSKDVARIWVNEDLKMRSFSPTNVSLSLMVTNYCTVAHKTMAHYTVASIMSHLLELC